MPSQEIAHGSLASRDQSIAHSFATGVKILVLIDISFSMNADDCPGGQTRYQAACAQLRKLQADNPGKVGVIEWSEKHAFCPGGIPSPSLGPCTDMAAVLNYARIADGCDIRIVLISDGQPDCEQSALDAARRYTGKVDTIYIGPENGPGAEFLRRLSALTGGIASTRYAGGIHNLADDMSRLLTA